MAFELHRAAGTAALALALLALGGCWHKWSFEITSVSAGKPQFCISKQPNCMGTGVSMSEFEIQEVSSPGQNERYRTVWAITRTGNQPLRTFAYGVTPVGWKQKVAPEQLETGKVYSVGPYWFRFEGKGMAYKVRYEIAPAGKLK